MTLPDFIAEVGDQKAAELFRAPVRTVQSWRRGERRPRPDMARVIVSKTGGVVSFAGIYDGPPQDEDGAHVRHPARAGGDSV